MKRHYVTIEVTVYAEDDEDAIRKSETLCKSIHQDSNFVRSLLFGSGFRAPLTPLPHK